MASVTAVSKAVTPNVSVSSMSSPANTVSPASSATASSISSVLTSWKNFDLDATRVQIDQQAIAMCGNEDRSMTSRKALAELLRGAKKAPEKEKIKAMGLLIKRFQKEVDELTRRSAYAESCFVSLYKRLYELPDPVNNIAVSLNQEKEIEENNVKIKLLHKQVSEYDAEFNSLKNQEVRVRELDSRIRELEAELKQAAQRAGDSQSSEMVERERQQLIEEFKGREQQINSELQTTRDRLFKTQLAHDTIQEQLFRVSNTHDHEEATRDSESMMLFDELEQANSSIVSLRREKDELLDRVRHLQTTTVSTPNVDKPNSHGVVHTLELRVADLEQRLHESNVSKASEVQKLSNTIDAERIELQHAQDAVSNLQQQIASRPIPEEHEKLKRKLHMIQAVQFNALDIDGEDEDVLAVSGSERELETRLLKKNKRLESELTVVRRELTESGQKLVEQQQANVTLHDNNSAKSVLIAKLEKSVEAYSSNTVKHDILKDIAHTQRNTSLQLNDDDDDDDEPTPFDIIVGQRDRYRLRVDTLEAEIMHLQARNDEYGKHSERVCADNVKLYEKMQYVKSYRPGLKARDVDVDVDVEEGGGAAGGGAIGRYKKMYDESTNPFVAFSRKQKQQRYQKLNTFDKVTLNTAQVVLGSKRLRTLLVVYLLAMHLLVFITLVTHTVSNHCHTIANDTTNTI